MTALPRHTSVPGASVSVVDRDHECGVGVAGEGRLGAAAAAADVVALVGPSHADVGHILSRCQRL